METESSGSLSASLTGQERLFSKAFAILHEAIEQRVFPAASIAVTQSGKLVALKAIGDLVYKEDFDRISPQLHGGIDRSKIVPQTLFDLASLTKPIATTSAAMILHERGLLELDAPIVGTVPEFASPSDPRRQHVSFRMLLAHSSGLPAYEKLFLKARSRSEMLNAALGTGLGANPGTRAEYSDIGFIILGIALERIAQEPLDTFCQREIFGPLAMADTTFSPPPALRTQIPPTADERQNENEIQGSGRTFRDRIIQGEVQDENAFVLGGIAGHAGLFSTAEDVSRFAHAMLRGGAPILRRETIALFTQQQSEPSGTTRALGWDTPSKPSQSGRYFGPRSYGHLGYTGTSLWVDPDRQLSVTLLTNRIWPDCSNQAIKQVRPKFHDAIVEALR